MKINYFFGSDARSIPAYEILVQSNKELHGIEKNYLNVVTLDNPKMVRGKTLRNEFETYCIDNSIEYSYYNSKERYTNLDNALVCSFGKIFSKGFLELNNFIGSNKSKLLLNLHLSLLPDLKGPTPVEYAILYSYKKTGVSLFAITEEIDSGLIYWSKEFEIDVDEYATDLYTKSFKSFELFMLDNQLYTDIFTNKIYSKPIAPMKVKKTYKINDCDLLLNNLKVDKAKERIRALNYLGPAIYEYESNLILKIHSYTKNGKGLKLDLIDGILYADYITPPGKNRMNASDWLRGRK